MQAPAPGSSAATARASACKGFFPLTRLPPGAYAAAVSERVYAAMRDEAAQVLASGASVVLDAVFARPAEREAAERLAAACGVTFEGFWLEAPLATLAERVVARRGDPSDATPAVLAAQARRDCGTITWHRLDAGLAPEALAWEALGVGTADGTAGEGDPRRARSAHRHRRGPTAYRSINRSRRRRKPPPMRDGEELFSRLDFGLILINACISPKTNLCIDDQMIMPGAGEPSSAMCIDATCRKRPVHAGRSVAEAEIHARHSQQSRQSARYANDICGE